LILPLQKYFLYELPKDLNRILLANNSHDILKCLRSLTVQCVKDGKTSVQCGGGGGTPTVSQRVETDVDLAYQVVSAVCVVVYQPVRRRSKHSSQEMTVTVSETCRPTNRKREGFLTSRR